MTISDLLIARGEWARQHGRRASWVFIPKSLSDEFWNMVMELPSAGSLHGCGITYLCGMRIEASPFKSDRLDFA
jgi:hypothetical protein